MQRAAQHIVQRAVHHYSTYLLTGVPAAGSILAELAFEVVDGDDLHHDAALHLVLQVQVPRGRGV